MSKPPTCCSTYASLHAHAPARPDQAITHTLYRVEETPTEVIPFLGVDLTFQSVTDPTDFVLVGGGGASYTEIYNNLVTSLEEHQRGTNNLFVPPSSLRFAFVLEEELQLA